MKILITGINGYLGSHITSELLNQGHDITGLTIEDFSSANPWKGFNVDIIIGDIRDKALLNKISKKQFDAIIHLVSLDHFGSEGEVEFVNSINVIPTWNLLDIFTKKGLTKFIYFSTQQVYGKLDNANVDETYPTAPINNYGLTHLMSEDIVKMYNNKISTDAISVRLSNSYGNPVFNENNCWWLVVNDLCKTAYENNKIQLKSDGSPIRDFIHVTDVANAVNKLLVTDTKNENVFNISSGKTFSILKLAHIVKEVYYKRYNKDIDVILKNGLISETSEIYDNDEVYFINPSKLNSIGFKAQVNLHEGINMLFDYLEKQNSK